MQNKLSFPTRIVLLISATMLALALYYPLWRIDLDAPQYPEGLSLTIYANGLKGNVDIINGLNHYIGMKTLHNADFPEFSILPYLVVCFSLAMLLTAVFNRRTALHIVFIALVVFGIAAMYDFWRWEYNYGHQLDPNAAIIVPGMAYQPPLIGFKQLLNFGAYSAPAFGGWLFVTAGVALLLAVIYEWRRSKRTASLNVHQTAIALGICVLLMSGCQPAPTPIVPGKDACSYCKMGIVSTQYAAELVTAKGKVYKFDDVHCMISHLKAAKATTNKNDQLYFCDFVGNHALIPAAQALLLSGDSISTPMNGHIIAFSNQDSLSAAAARFGATITNWKNINR